MFNKKCWAWKFFLVLFISFFVPFFISSSRESVKSVVSTEPQFRAKNRWNFIYDNTFLRRVVTCEMNHFFFTCPCSPWDRNKNMMYNVDRWWLVASFFWKLLLKTFKLSLKGSGKRFALKVSSDAEASKNWVRQIILRLVYLLFLSILCRKKVFSAIKHSSWKFFKHGTHSSL